MGGIYEVRRWDGLTCHDIYILSFIKIGSDIQNLIRGDIQTHRQHGDRISLLLFFSKWGKWENRRTYSRPDNLCGTPGHCLYKRDLCPPWIKEASHETPNIYKILYWTPIVLIWKINIILWNITPCSLVEVYRCFGVTCRLHIQGRKVSQTSNILLPWFAKEILDSIKNVLAGRPLVTLTICGTPEQAVCLWLI
jgi:hypothetical protein